MQRLQHDAGRPTPHALRAATFLFAGYALTACALVDGDSAEDTHVRSRVAHAVSGLDAGVPASAPSLDAAVDASHDPSSPNLIVLRDLQFFDLPINSIRYAVSGHDSATGLCISAVFYLNSFSRQRHCDLGGSWFPYVVVERATKPGCWGYGPNASIESIRGCVDFALFGRESTGDVQLTMTISSEPWSGTVIFDAQRRTP